MKNVNCNILNASDAASQNGSQVDANQLVSGSFQFYFGDANAAGTAKIQASNDPCPYGNVASQFTATHWIDIPNATASITSGSAAIITIANMAYRWVRAIYTSSASFKQVQTVIAVADVAGSLNSTYFLISSIHTGVQKNFYVWFDDGAGVDPALPGKTGVRVVYSDNATASTLGGLIRAALGALTSDFTASGSGANAIITNVENGLATAASDGVAATGFTFQNTTPGVNPTTINCNMNALSI